jgi:hypothetical protein
MSDLLQFLADYGKSTAITVTLVATFATVLRKLFVELLFNWSAKLKRASRPGQTNPTYNSETLGGPPLEKAGRTRDSARSSHSVARTHAVIRLNDARAARTKEQSSARVSRILSGSLTFAQVVIGGVLASSFVQESLPPKTVGIFGVLVLIASLVKQQYHPEVDAEQARQNASKLKALIRMSEDKLVVIDARSAKGEDRTDALIELAKEVSRGITEIENPEAIMRGPDVKPAPLPEPE